MGAQTRLIDGGWPGGPDPLAVEPPVSRRFQAESLPN
jgi:hypothetical protein